MILLLFPVLNLPYFLIYFTDILLMCCCLDVLIFADLSVFNALYKLHQLVFLLYSLISVVAGSGTELSPLLSVTTLFTYTLSFSVIHSCRYIWWVFSFYIQCNASCHPCFKGTQSDCQRPQLPSTNSPRGFLSVHYGRSPRSAISH